MLYEYLLNRARHARFHMPGHKGVSLMGAHPELFDITELPDTGNLYDNADDIIKASERLAAADYGSDGCVFLAGGSTLGIQAALAAAMSGAPRRGVGGGCAADGHSPTASAAHDGASPRGDAPPCAAPDANASGAAALMYAAAGRQRRCMLAERNAHMAFCHACALLDIDAEFLLDINAATIEAALTYGDYDAVFITSPDYYGRLLDTAAIYNVCKRFNVPLVLDAAHGAHLEWLGIKQRADYVVMSAHKTLPALGGSAMVHCYGGSNERNIDMQGRDDDTQHRADTVRRFARVFGSSSPSFLILASLDRALGELRRDGGAAYKETARAVSELVGALDGTEIHCICGDNAKHNCDYTENSSGYARRVDGVYDVRSHYTEHNGQSSHPSGDPTRLYIAHQNMDGFAFANMLRERGIEPELIDRRGVVLIVTTADLGGNLERLGKALRFAGGGTGDNGIDAQSASVPPPATQRVMSLREALLAPQERVALRDAVGRVASQCVSVYPPGIPAVMPGEIITQKTLTFLAESMYNIDSTVAVAVE